MKNLLRVLLFVFLTTLHSQPSKATTIQEQMVCESATQLVSMLAHHALQRAEILVEALKLLVALFSDVVDAVGAALESAGACIVAFFSGDDCGEAAKARWNEYKEKESALKNWYNNLVRQQDTWRNRANAARTQTCQTPNSGGGPNNIVPATINQCVAEELPPNCCDNLGVRTSFSGPCTGMGGAGSTGSGTVYARIGSLLGGLNRTVSNTNELTSDDSTGVDYTQYGDQAAATISDKTLAAPDIETQEETGSKKGTENNLNNSARRGIGSSSGGGSNQNDINNTSAGELTASDAEKENTDSANSEALRAASLASGYQAGSGGRFGSSGLGRSESTLTEAAGFSEVEKSLMAKEEEEDDTLESGGRDGAEGGTQEENALVLDTDPLSLFKQISRKYGVKTAGWETSEIDISGPEAESNKKNQDKEKNKSKIDKGTYQFLTQDPM